jgi:hypothetical protein
LAVSQTPPVSEKLNLHFTFSRLRVISVGHFRKNETIILCRYISSKGSFKLTPAVKHKRQKVKNKIFRIYGIF